MRKNRLGSDFGHEVWQFLPERFTMAYQDLCSRALAGPKTAQTDAVKVGGTGEPKSPLGSDSALSDKARVDRVLRRLATEITTGKRVDDRVKCGCGKFIPMDWAYCAWCGLGKGSVRIVPGPETRPISWGRLR